MLMGSESAAVTQNRRAVAEGPGSGGGSRAFAGQATPHLWMVAPEMRFLVCNSLFSCALMSGPLSEYPVCLRGKDLMLESSDRHGKRSGYNTMWKTSGYKSTLQFGSFWRGNMHSLHSKQEIFGEQRQAAYTQVKGEKLQTFPLPLSTFSDV